MYIRSWSWSCIACIRTCIQNLCIKRIAQIFFVNAITTGFVRGIKNLTDFLIGKRIFFRYIFIFIWASLSTWFSSLWRTPHYSTFSDSFICHFTLFYLILDISVYPFMFLYYMHSGKFCWNGIKSENCQAWTIRVNM